ncbi:MAG: NitT/TauT family transport system substrate-binding protein [Candidatus Binatota bacterium]|jgi:NitT/TauT family transport system substrate-binding protein|nr:NitT/TauT family transport system substrate-binding protein [Candidatus Binatota bacterium]
MKTTATVLFLAALIAVFVGARANAQSEKLRVAMASISTSQVNLWVPLDTGLFKKHRLDVDLVFISGAPIVNAALLSGEVAIAQGGPAPSIQTNLKGAGTYIILGNTNRFPYQLVVAPNIKEIADLKGKRFAIARIGAADHSAVLFVLPRLGLQPERELSLIAVGAVPSRFAALVSGSVGATLLIPPETTKARELGFRVLANFMDIDVDFQQNAIYTTKSFIDRKTDTLRRFVMAYSEGIHYIHTNAKGTQQIMKKYLKGDDKAIEEAYTEVVLKAAPKIPYPTKSGLQTLMKFMAATTPEIANTKPEDFIDTRFIKELEDSGFYARLYR